MTHVRHPALEGVRPLSELADAIPRLPDLERSYRDLWKLYVLAATDDTATLQAVARIATRHLPDATNAYRPA